MARSPTEAPGTNKPAEPRVKIALAWLAAAWEAAWRAAWPVATVLGAFLVLAGFDLLPDLPGWLHALILVAFAAALVVASRPLWRLRLPDGLAARRRLERDSGIEHRPLTALHDTQATGTSDPLSRVLWQRHLAQRAAQLRLLKPRLPRPRNAEADRFALRGLVVIGLILAVVAAGDDWRGRLGRAFSPGLFGASAATAPRLDLFVTPPSYTGKPPIYLTAGRSPRPASRRRDRSRSRSAAPWSAGSPAATRSPRSASPAATPPSPRSRAATTSCRPRSPAATGCRSARTARCWATGRSRWCPTRRPPSPSPTSRSRPSARRCGSTPPRPTITASPP